MTRSWLTAALVVVSAAAFACKPAAKDNGAEAFRPLDVGAEVPAYSAITLAGDTVHVGGGAGTPTVVNVWATWCASCREEMAALDSLKSEFGARGVRVIGVSVDQGRIDKVRQYVESNRLGFSVSHDPAGDIQRLYQVVGVPATFVVGKDGHLVWRHTGNIAAILDEVRASVRKAIADKTGP
jgi:peroxiredoxin